MSAFHTSDLRSSPLILFICLSRDIDLGPVFPLLSSEASLTPSIDLSKLQLDHDCCQELGLQLLPMIWATAMLFRNFLQIPPARESLARAERVLLRLKEILTAPRYRECRAPSTVMVSNRCRSRLPIRSHLPPYDTTFPPLRRRFGSAPLRPGTPHSNATKLSRPARPAHSSKDRSSIRSCFLRIHPSYTVPPRQLRYFSSTRAEDRLTSRWFSQESNRYLLFQHGKRSCRNAVGVLGMDQLSKRGEG